MAVRVFEKFLLTRIGSMECSVAIAVICTRCSRVMESFMLLTIIVGIDVGRGKESSAYCTEDGKANQNFFHCAPHFIKNEEIGDRQDTFLRRLQKDILQDYGKYSCTCL